MRFIRQYPLSSYFLLAYAIFWIIWIPLIPHLQNLATFELSPWVILLALIGIYAPTFAALIVVSVSEGRIGLRRLLAPLWDWRLRWTWYATATFLPLVLAVTAVLIHMGITKQYSVVTSFDWFEGVSIFFFSIPLLILAKLPLGPMAEELGWRGFALPRLQRRMSALNASLILGVLWALWHLPAFWVPGAALPLDEAPTLMGILQYVVNVVGVSLVFTWIYNSTRGSLLIDFLFHAAYNALPTLLFVTTSITPSAFTWVVWAFAILLLLRYRPEKMARAKVTKE